MVILLLTYSYLKYSMIGLIRTMKE